MSDSRTPQGVRGLKQTEAGRPVAYSSRTPQGVRGLKRVVECPNRKEDAVALRKECVD